jgi:hypothetical protein
VGTSAEPTLVGFLFRTWAVVIAWICLAGLSADAAALTGPAGSQSQRPPVRSLKVSLSKTPHLPMPAMVTSGSFPLFTDPRIDLSRVNVVVRRVVLDDERRFRARALHVDPRTAPGVYNTSPDLRLVSASTVVVSVLLPAVKLYPSGNDGASWISVTVAVATGRAIGIADIFEDSARGLHALAAEAYNRLRATNTCVKGSVDDRILGRDFSRGFQPTAANYKYTALLPRGVTVGFPVGQVAAPACGRVSVRVPYSTVRPYLNDLGRALIRGVRRPRL